MTLALRVQAIALVTAATFGCNGRFNFDDVEPAHDAAAVPPDTAASGGQSGSVDGAGSPDEGAQSFDAPAVRLDSGSIDAAARADVGSLDAVAMLMDAPGGDSSPAAPTTCTLQSQTCICSGTLCSCARQQWCRFNGDGCGPTSGSCTILCHNATRCEGQCQHGCHLECENGSSCALTMGDNSSADSENSTLTVTVGAMSTVQCENNANCHVTCTGPCTVSCQGAHCDLRCAGDATSHNADMGGSCLK